MDPHKLEELEKEQDIARDERDRNARVAELEAGLASIAEVLGMANPPDSAAEIACAVKAKLTALDRMRERIVKLEEKISATEHALWEHINQWGN